MNAQLEATGLNIGGSQYTEKSVGMFYVTVNSLNKVISCSSETSVAYFCTKMGGTYIASTNDCNIEPAPEQVCAAVGGDFKSATNSCEVDPKPQKVCSSMGGTYKNGTCDLKIATSGTASCKDSSGKVVAKHGELYKTVSGGCWKTATYYQCFDGNLVKQSSKKSKDC